MAKKQTRKAKAAKPIAKKKAPNKTPKPRRAVERRTKPQKSCRPGVRAASQRTPQGSEPGAPNGAARTPGAEVPLAVSPEPLLHSQVDRPVEPVTATPDVEKAAVSNRTEVPFGTVRT